MTIELKVLKCGYCEPLKLGVHGLALGLAAVCALYNAAAWVSRREHHLAVNAVLYAALITFEQRHVSHHIAELRRPKTPPGPTPVPSVVDVPLVIEAVAFAASKTAA